MENKFGQLLKSFRKENNMSQQSLAHLVGVSQQCISDWENGKIEPTLSYLCKIADIFEISLDVLTGRKDY